MNVQPKMGKSTASDESSDEEVRANDFKLMVQTSSMFSSNSTIVEPESHYSLEIYLTSPKKVVNFINNMI